MRINVLSHRAFDMWMQEFGFSDERLPDKDEAVISICCTPEIKHNYLEGYKHETDEHWFKEQHDNVLNVDFDDITTPTKQINRLDYTINNLNTTRENLVASESRIRDLDIAQASADLVARQVRLQSAFILTQAIPAPCWPRLYCLFIKRNSLFIPYAHVPYFS